MELPLRLPRKTGRYLLRFESPGRQGQILEVDGMAARHEVRLSMPALASERPRSIRRERADDDEPQPASQASQASQASPQVEIFSPPAEPAPPPKPRPSLIEDVDDEPAPSSPPEKPRIPLIDEP